MTHWTASYIGKPWANGAAGPHAYDCWGLVRAIYASRYGVTLDAVNVDANQPLAVRHVFLDSAVYAGWQNVIPSALQEGDVVLLSQARHPHHVGIWIDGALLHSVEGHGVCRQNRQSLRLHGWNILRACRRSAK